MTKETSPGKPPLLKRLGVATLIMVASVFLSRVVGFIREVVIAGQQGANGETDAYFTAFTLPDIFNYFLAGGTLTITFIPLFSEYLARGDEEGGWDLFSTIATGTGALMVVAVAVGEAFAPQLVPLIAPGFDEGQVALCARMTRIVMPGMFCFMIGGLLQATLLSKERFGAVAAIPIVYNVMIILGGVLLGPWLGVEGFAWGALVGAVVGPLAIPVWASRGSIRYRLRFNFRSEGFGRYIKLALPLMLGVSLISLDEWFLRAFGSYLEAGTISWLNNARRLMLVPVAIVGQAAGQAAMPFLSGLWARGQHEELARTLTTSIRAVLFYAVLAGSALATLAEPVVFAAFHRGEFTSADASGTAVLLGFFALGVAAWSVQGIVARGFYARHDTLQPMLLGSAVALLSVPLYWGLGESMGGRGLALASCLGITVNALVLTVVFRWRCAPIDLGAIGRTLAQSLLCALPGGAACLGTLWGLKRVGLEIESTAGAVLMVAIAGGVHLAVSLSVAQVMKVEELSFLARIAAKVGLRR